MEATEPENNVDNHPLKQVDPEVEENPDLSPLEQCIEKVKVKLSKMDLVDNTYFQKDRKVVIKTIHDEIMDLLNQHEGVEQNKKVKSEYLYYRGKCIDYLPEFQKEAEECLTKAAKLRPTWHLPMSALGHVYWKKQDIENSVLCYRECLEEEPSDKSAMRCLSMVIRQQKHESAEAMQKAYDESTKLANSAVALDLKDGYSWYVLGNAHLSSFFALQSNFDNLNLALKAYTQAQKNSIYDNPDLFFNRATIYEYLERYGDALIDYKKAHLIDPDLQANSKVDGILEFVTSTARMIQLKKKTKTKKVTQLVKNISESISDREIKFPSKREKSAPSKYKVSDQTMLENGDNIGHVLIGKVVATLEKSSDVPMCFLIVDSNYAFTVVSLYQTNKTIKEQLKYGDEVIIKDPSLDFVSIDFDKKLYSYPCVKVINILNILHNGEPLTETFKSELVTKTIT